jgi:hypothetical protein
LTYVNYCQFSEKSSLLIKEMLLWAKNCKYLFINIIKEEHMPQKTVKLNPLQSRTLALFQELARNPEASEKIEGSDDVSIMYFPKPHGNHVHIGNFVVSAKDASGFTNEVVWKVLERKGLAKSEFPYRIILNKKGLEFDTGFKDEFEISDH